MFNLEASLNLIKFFLGGGGCYLPLIYVVLVWSRSCLVLIMSWSRFGPSWLHYWLYSFKRSNFGWLVFWCSSLANHPTLPPSVSASSSSPLTSWPWPRRRWWWCTHCPESMKSGETFVTFMHHYEMILLQSRKSLLISWFLSCLCVSLSVWRWTRTREQRISARLRTACTSGWPCWPLCWADRSIQDFSPKTRESIGTPAFYLPHLILWIPLLLLSFQPLSVSFGHIRRHYSSTCCSPLHTYKRMFVTSLFF